MMKAYIFPGQGVQFPTMGQDLYEKFPIAKQLFEQANDILGFPITDIMFEGTVVDLKQTKVTQPAIFLHSVIMTKVLENFKPDMVAGHSLGEFSALVANGVLSFEDALQLVHKRGLAMQKSCEINPSTMAAILGLEDKVVADLCNEISDIVVPANYNCPGQLVISGTMQGVQKACALATKKGAKRTLLLPVGGGFHSELMNPAKEALATHIEKMNFKKPICPIYQNVSTTAVTDITEIKNNLVNQLTTPVRWTQSIQQMIKDGGTEFIEIGPGKVLQGLLRKIDSHVKVGGLTL